MKFIKAIQKAGTPSRKVNHKPAKRDSADDAKISRLVPGLLTDSLKVGGAASVAEVEHSPGRSVHDVAVGTMELPADLPASELTPSYSTVSVDPERVNPHLVALTDPKSAFAEEYRDLRTSILHKSKKQRLKAVSVVSVAPGEGKSVTALNLAWLLAQTEGVKALLIDGDMRRPSLSRYLGIEDGPGLSELLDDELSLSEAIIRLEPSGLHLLRGGRSRNDVAEQLSGPNFARLLERVQEIFDFVIIDAPPLGVFVDAKVLVNLTDGALLVLRRNFTNYKELDRVMEGLPRQRMLGVVLNQAEDTVISGRYYYDQY